jgi:hypothetical protein
LATLIGRITVENAVAGSSASLDGNSVGTAPLRELVVNPGRHTLELQREGYANFKAGVDVPVGGATVLTAKQLELVKVLRVEVPAKERTPLYKKWWLWTIVGGALVAGGVVAAVVVTTRPGTSGLDVQLPAVR